MRIEKAKFIKGIVQDDELLHDGKPQIALIGRSNVGKSSIINSLTNQLDLARTSSFPGRTQQINTFLINDSHYLMDLPGYGFSKDSKEKKEELQELINWYLFNAGCDQHRVVLIIDAKVGPTNADIDILRALEKFNKNILIVANKIDKVRPSKQAAQFKAIQELVGDHKIIACSSYDKIGIKELNREIFS